VIVPEGEGLEEAAPVVARDLFQHRLRAVQRACGLIDRLDGTDDVTTKKGR
jgi:hypothetical protein